MLPRLAVSLVVASLALPLVPSAQERPDPTSTGNGPRGVALSGAITAVTDDVTSIGWNPAGLSRLSKTHFVIISRALVMTTSAKGTTNQITQTGFPKFGAEGEFAGALDAIEFVGLAVPFTVGGREVAAGVAYRWFADGIRVGAFRQTRLELSGRFFSKVQYFNEGGTRAISPSLAVAVTPRLRLGVTANVLSGESEYRVIGPLTARSSLREKEYAGLALQTGALFQYSDDLSIGAQITLPHNRTLSLETDSTQVDATRAAPLQLAVGIAKVLNPKSTLSADIRYAPWSSVDFTEDATGDVIDNRVGVADATSLHVGWERDLSDEDQNSLLRLGGFFRTTTSQGLDGKGISAFGASIGQAWYWERYNFDAGFQVARSTRWVRSDTPQTTTSLANTDFILSLGLTRIF